MSTEASSKMKFVLIFIIVLVGVTAYTKKKPILCSFYDKPGNGAECLPRFFYYSWLNECRPFNYTGSGGNTNNFESEEECFETCKDVPCTVKPTLCYFFQRLGNGTENVERYYYYSLLSECQKFNYTGSGGNLNNFATEEECQNTCNADTCD